MKFFFDHEKLDVYRESIVFCGWAGELLATITVRAAVKDQLDHEHEHEHDYEGRTER